MIVCLGAGEVHSGAFDDFARAIPVARRYDAWVHVDGAFGLWAAASPSYRHLTTGMADADSWATDAHKTLNVPYDSGLAIVRDPAALIAGFGVEADYLIGAAGDPMERVPEFSRRARGFAVWAALRSLGRDGLAVLVDRLSATASMLAKGFEEVDEVEVVNDVVFTQVMFRLSTRRAHRRAGPAPPRRRHLRGHPRRLARPRGPALRRLQLVDHRGRRRRDRGRRTPPGRRPPAPEVEEGRTSRHETSGRSS